MPSRTLRDGNASTLQHDPHSKGLSASRAACRASRSGARRRRRPCARAAVHVQPRGPVERGDDPTPPGRRLENTHARVAYCPTLQHAPRPIRTAVIHGQQLPRAFRLCEQRRQRLGKPRRGVSHRHENGNARVIRDTVASSLRPTYFRRAAAVLGIDETAPLADALVADSLAEPYERLAGGRQRIRKLRRTDDGAEQRGCGEIRHGKRRSHQIRAGLNEVVETAQNHERLLERLLRRPGVDLHVATHDRAYARERETVKRTRRPGQSLPEQLRAYRGVRKELVKERETHRRAEVVVEETRYLERALTLARVGG